MEKNLLNIWYADEKKINSISKILVYNDIGLLSFSDKIIYFKGKKNSFSINKESVQNISLTNQKMNWVVYIIINLLLILFFYLVQTNLVPALIYILFGNVLGLISGFKTKWICIKYLDQNQILKKAYFADGTKGGWNGIFGSTKKLYNELIY